VDAEPRPITRKAREKQAIKPVFGVVLLVIVLAGAGIGQAIRGWFPANEEAALTGAEREPMRVVGRDGARWLEQPALGISMRDPGPEFHPVMTLPPETAAALKPEAAPFVQVFVFEDAVGSRIAVTVTKLASPSAADRLLPSNLAKLVTGMEALAAQAKIALRVETNDIVETPGGRVGRYSTAIGDAQHNRIRVVPFARRGAGFTAILSGGSTVPSAIEAMDTFAARP